VRQFETSAITPKAFANFSPGLERSDNPGIGHKIFIETLQGSSMPAALTAARNWETTSTYFLPIKLTHDLNLARQVPEHFGITLA